MSADDKVTTKHCPKCGNTNLVLIGTYNLKHCTDCNLDIPWYREEGQPSIYGGVAVKEREE